MPKREKQTHQKELKLDIKNTYERLTLSGLDPEKIRNCKNSTINAYFEYFNYKAAVVLGIDDEAAQALIGKMASYSCVGDFLWEEKEQKKELAAYTLVILDRLVRAADANDDGWSAMGFLFQLYELMSYLDPDTSESRFNAKMAAYKRHSEHRAMKDDLFDWYCKHHQHYSSMNAAAEVAIKIVPVKFRTARDWISEFSRRLKNM